MSKCCAYHGSRSAAAIPFGYQRSTNPGSDQLAVPTMILPLMAYERASGTRSEIDRAQSAAARRAVCSRLHESRQRHIGSRRWRRREEFLESGPQLSRFLISSPRPRSALRHLFLEFLVYLPGARQFLVQSARPFRALTEFEVKLVNDNPRAHQLLIDVGRPFRTS